MSAGILAYRRGAGRLEVLLVHPGGPYWRNKDNGAWSIPKGEIDGTDDPEQTAEELGPTASIGPLTAVGEVRQRNGKRVIAFAGEGKFDPAALLATRSRSNGRLEAVGDKSLPKSIARTGLRSNSLEPS